jgi:hypothetical protein
MSGKIKAKELVTWRHTHGRPVRRSWPTFEKVERRVAITVPVRRVDRLEDETLTVPLKQL